MTKKGKSRIPIALVILLIVTNAATLYYFMFYRQSVPIENVQKDVWDIKGPNKESRIGQTLATTGYFIVAVGFPMLTSDLLVFVNNSLSSSNYMNGHKHSPAVAY